MATQQITNRQLKTPGGGGGSSMTQLANATDASFTMQANAVIFLPAATLTQNRTITMPSGSAGDQIQFFNLEAGFSWLLAGVQVLLSDGITVVTQLLANTNYSLEFISGKWRVLN